jgi:hypothetical protein
MNWINVKDQLPQQDEWVLIYNYYNDSIRTANFDLDDYDGITHWMPLPDKPKEEYS